MIDRKDGAGAGRDREAEAARGYFALVDATAAARRQDRGLHRLAVTIDDFAADLSGRGLVVSPDDGLGIGRRFRRARANFAPAPLHQPRRRCRRTLGWRR